MIYNSSDGCFILREIKHLSSTFNELFLFRDLKKKKKKVKANTIQMSGATATTILSHP